MALEEIKFKSSLTNQTYYIKVNENGYLDLYYQGTDSQVPRYDNPSRKAIVRQALEDLEINFPSTASVGNLIRRLYQAIRKNNSSK